MMDNVPLTITGLIATILSVIFAIAAMLNSRRRRLAARSAARAKSDEADELDDRPYKIADPFTAATFTTPPPVAAEAPAQSAAPSAAAPAPVAPRPAITAFRQLDAHGIEVAPSANSSEDAYVWE